MLTLPKSIAITRSLKSEETLISKSRKWLTQEERKDGIHASDLLDPRMAFFRRKHPAPIPDRLVNMFIVGKIGHAIVLSAVDGAKGLNPESDEGSIWSEELKIWYSPDKTLGGIPRELKTTRSPDEAVYPKDLALYCEQLMIYMAAQNSTVGQLWILYLNLRDEEGNTAPQWRAFTIRVTQEELDEYKRQLKQTAATLEYASKKDDPTGLPLCREFKCGKKRCEYWEECQPEGRYGRPDATWRREAKQLAKGTA